MKVIKQRHRLVIIPEDESDEAFLDDTMGFTPDEPEGVVKAEFSPEVKDISLQTTTRTGKIWNLTIKSLKEEKES